MEISLIIAIVIVVLWCASLIWCASLTSAPKSKKASKHKGLKNKPAIKMLNRDGDTHDDEWHTYIAGLPYRSITKYDIGGFTGWIENDSANTHEAKAMGVYNSFGKLLGYIPAKELAAYRLWCDTKPMPCVGFVFIEDGQYRGRVKILRPCNEEFLQTEFSRYLQWVNANFGKDYLPKSMSMTFETE